MPFTPFHLGPALFFGLILFRYIHFPAFMIANIIPDLEPFIVLFLDLDQPLHGLSHSFAGGSVIAIILSLLMVRYNFVRYPAGFFKAGQAISQKTIWLASFSGIYLHILFDAPLYTDIMPFYPSDINPFFNSVPASEIYFLCILLFAAGFLIYGLKTMNLKVK